MIVRVSSGLVRMGVRKGDIITIYSPNCMEYMVIAMAINAVGAVFSGVNPAYNSGLSVVYWNFEVKVVILTIYRKYAENITIIIKSV